MRIIYQGRVPGIPVYVGTCPKCGTIVEAIRQEIKAVDSLQTDTHYYVACPTPTCHTRIIVMERRG